MAKAHVDQLWSSLRASPAPVALNLRDTVWLARAAYDKLKELHSNEPGAPARWSAVKGLSRAIREQRSVPRNVPTRLSLENIPENIAETIKGNHATLTEAVNSWSVGGDEAQRLEERFGEIADYVLALHRIGHLEPASRSRLLIEIDKAVTIAAKELKRNAAGDYSPNDEALRFPSAPSDALVKATPPAPTTKTKQCSWDAAFAAWEREHTIAQKQPTTRPQYRSMIDKFAVFTKKPPAEIARDDLHRWTDHRLKDVTLSTIRSSDLAVLRAIIEAAKRAELLPDSFVNPATAFRLPRTSGTSVNSGDRRGYTNEEAKVILLAASKATDPLLHWVPWILALSGARVSEVAALRPFDVKTIDGIVAFSVTPEAGRHVKSAHSIRSVPIHPAVLDAGFMAFVESRKDADRLFFDVRKTRRGVGAVKPAKGAVAKLRKWVRKLPGLTIGAVHGVDPNHGWRHRFRTVALDAGVDSRVVDAICGHAPATVGAGYGSVSVKAMANSLRKLSVPK